MLLISSWQDALQRSHAQGKTARLDAQRPRSITKARGPCNSLLVIPRRHAPASRARQPWATSFSGHATPREPSLSPPPRPPVGVVLCARPHAHFAPMTTGRLVTHTVGRMVTSGPRAAHTCSCRSNLAIRRALTRTLLATDRFGRRSLAVAGLLGAEQGRPFLELVAVSLAQKPFACLFLVFLRQVTEK